MSYAHSYTRAVLRWLIEQWNGLRGYRFFWVDTPGTPGGGYIDFTPGTCPYPLRNDWSAKACIKAGDCGCDERFKQND